jgi:hypothetical protein
MDLVGALGAQLKLDEPAAASLAGGLLLLVEDLVRERVGVAASAQLRAAIPELAEWQNTAPTIAPGALTLDTLPPPAAPGDEGEFAAVLSRVGLEAGKTALATTLLEQFLSRRLDSAALNAVVAAIPLFD